MLFAHARYLLMVLPTHAIGGHGLVVDSSFTARFFKNPVVSLNYIVDTIPRILVDFFLSN